MANAGFVDRTTLNALSGNLHIGDTADPALRLQFFQYLADLLDADWSYISSLVQSGVLSPYPPVNYNKLINGNFDVWQRGTAQITSTSGTYFPDRFLITSFSTNVSSVKIDQGTVNPPSGSKYYLRNRFSTASAVVTSIARVFEYKMEADEVQKLLGKEVTISFKINTSLSRALGYSVNVYGFTGIDNGVKGTGIITGNGDYEQNSIALTANTWTTITKTFTVQNPSTGTGLATNGISIGLNVRYTTTGAETDTEYQIAQVQLNVGNSALPFQPRSFAEELALCLRYYEKSYQYSVAPATPSTAAGIETKIVYSNTIANTDVYGKVSYKVKKRTGPTVAIYPFTTPTNTGRVSNKDGADLGANSGGVINSGDDGFTMINSSGGSLTTTSNAVIFHWAADSEL